MTNSNQVTRLREHPEVRGISASQSLNISAALAQLRAEVHAAIHGHRQVTVFHHLAFSLVLFDFDAGGVLPDHVVNGMVSIHVLEGMLTVHAADTDYPLAVGEILVLNPSVAHSVRAEIASAMLLTVHQLEPAGSE